MAIHYHLLSSKARRVSFVIRDIFNETVQGSPANLTICLQPFLVTPIKDITNLVSALSETHSYHLEVNQENVKVIEDPNSQEPLTQTSKKNL